MAQFDKILKLLRNEKICPSKNSLMPLEYPKVL